MVHVNVHELVSVRPGTTLQLSHKHCFAVVGLRASICYTQAHIRYDLLSTTVDHRRELRFVLLAVRATTQTYSTHVNGLGLINCFNVL